MLSTKYKVIASSLMLSILAACGGTSSDTSATSAVTNAATTATTTAITPTTTTTKVVGPLTKYAGTWKFNCDQNNNYISTNIINVSSDGNSMILPRKDETYSSSACSGTIVATEVDSPPATATFIKTVANASVTMLSGEIITASVDLINIVFSNQTINVTGSGVTQSMSYGVTMWNVASSVTTTTIPLTRSARSGQTGLFFLNGKLIAADPATGSTTSFTEDSEASAVTN